MVARVMTVLLAGIFLLVSPLDCLTLLQSPDSMDCCAKKRCSPANEDDCCKSMVSGELPEFQASAKASFDPELLYTLLGTPLVASASTLSIVLYPVERYDHGPPRSLIKITSPPLLI